MIYLAHQEPHTKQDSIFQHYCSSYVLSTQEQQSVSTFIVIFETPVRNSQQSSFLGAGIIISEKDIYDEVLFSALG